VYVKRSSGDECIAFVTQYDASKNYYMVDLDRIGSGKLKQCRDREMRPATQATIIVTRSNGDEKRGIVQDFDKATNRYNILLEGTGILVSATADKVRPAGPQVGSTVLVTRSGGDETRAVVDAFDPAGKATTHSCNVHFTVAY
jgi:small nuclear ribonucleoprotein (snRNP)-like protein